VTVVQRTRRGHVYCQNSLKHFEITMDFFDSQEKARRRSRLLVFLFFVATVAIMLTVYLLVFLFLLSGASTTSQAWQEMRNIADVLVLLGVVIVTIIGLGTVFKMAQLRRGGSAVAELLGGRLLAPDSRVPDEQRVLNVVEEMAIASGLPVPSVYFLDQERGINAFAAGQSPGNAVVGLTAGSVQLLNRSELQAVIGHEFSHILNGDMRLNIRLMSMIHGLIILGLAGRMMLRMVAYGGRGSRDRRGAALPLVAGVGFVVIGSLGMLFGSLIKAAVSRQREYLADASSVQFTRDAQAMAGVLKKIGALSQGSRLDHPNAPQASHMFFAQGVNTFMSSLFATHPPLEERIRRIDPMWDGTYPAESVQGSGSVQTEQQETFGLSSLTATGRNMLDDADEVPDAEHLTAAVGGLDEAHVAYARQLKKRFPVYLLEAAHDQTRSPTVVFALLLDKEKQVAVKQLEVIGAAYGSAQKMDVVNLASGDLPRELYLPLLDLCFPALRRMSLHRYLVFRRVFTQMIMADGRVGLFEWALQRAVLRHLEPAFVAAKHLPSGYLALHQMVDEVSLILSALSHGSADAQNVSLAFIKGAQELRLSGVLLRKVEECTIQSLDQAVTRLNRLREQAKRDLITACAAVVLADVIVSTSQIELLRAISDALECPMPPLLPGQANSD
jgi:Zn-dependent protease with chaperone function